MRTVFVHHHAEDVLAAEVIAGALLSMARVEIISYPPGPQVIVQIPPGTPVENVVIWTEDAEDEPLMESLLRGLAVRRANCMLLMHPDLIAPADLISCACWPLFDRSTPWMGYRRALRSLFGDEAARPDRPTIPAPPPRPAPPPVTRIIEARIAEMMSGFSIAPYAVVAGLLLLALLR